MTTATVENPRIVSRAEWLTARKALLAREKRHTHERDAIAAERRTLPWVRIETSYIFDGLSGPQSLADLFQGRSQLIVYHFMFGPEWAEGCPSCSFNMDHTDATLIHLAQRDVSFAAISRAPIGKIVPFKQRMGWRFNWVSSFSSSFNRDFGVYFSKEELAQPAIYNFESSGFPSEEAPGFSVFLKQGDAIYHTYSAFARGTETLVNTYNYLDLVPKGRDEDNLYFPMAWVRHHDRYENGQLADSARPYWPAENDAPVKAAASSCCTGEHD